jgi:hypothetical protein
MKTLLLAMALLITSGAAAQACQEWRCYEIFGELRCKCR